MDILDGDACIGLVRQRVSVYLFNQQKQIKAIDAKLPNYKVTLNNHEENCNIKCNPGFYSQVARPSFSSLDEESVLTSSDTTMTVREVTVTKDKKGYEAKRKLHFVLKNQDHIGAVVVYLHHSTRRI